MEWSDEPKPSGEVNIFIEKFLRPDGVFVLKMVAYYYLSTFIRLTLKKIFFVFQISMHAGNIICSRLCEALWLHFLHWRNSIAINRMDAGGGGINSHSCSPNTVVANIDQKIIFFFLTK
jgi:hypothetical protein